MNSPTIDRVNGYLRQWDPVNRSTVLVHRKVAEATLGRPLRDDEVVHHINGNKTDNRPENLVVLTNSEHASLHARSNNRVRKTCWADDGSYSPVVPKRAHTERQKSSQRESYWKNRAARLEYQKAYDAAHKESKARYDKARREWMKRISAEPESEAPHGQAER